MSRIENIFAKPGKKAQERQRLRTIGKLRNADQRL
jgi:hypothetical protein